MSKSEFGMKHMHVIIPHRSYQIGILESVLCVYLWIGPSVWQDSWETACRNFLIFYMNIKYDLGMIFSKFLYHLRWPTGGHFIGQKTYFTLELVNDKT